MQATEPESHRDFICVLLFIYLFIYETRAYVAQVELKLV